MAVKISNRYDLKTIKKLGCQWNIIMGGRNSGKSFQVKKQIIADAYKEKKEFAYIRRYLDDIDIGAVLDYFNDITNNRDGKNYLEIWTEGNYNQVKAGQRKIWFIKTDEEGEEDKTVKPLLVGRYYAISRASKYKSREVPNIKNYVFEEFIPDGTPLLPKEPHYLESIVSSTSREEFVQVWLIGNNVNRDFYYFRYWNLNRIKKQKINTIDTYEFENGDYNENGEPIVVRFAVEIVPDYDGTKGIFFGRAVHVNSSDWTVKSQPYKHQSELENFDNIYQVFFEHHGFKWKCNFYIDEDGSRFWYVEPYTKDIKADERVISDIVSTNPRHSINIKPKNKVEEIGFELMKDGKVFFSDSLCGTEFKEAFATFVNANLTTEINQL